MIQYKLNMKFNFVRKFPIIGLLAALNSHAAELITLPQALKLAYPEPGATFEPKSLTLTVQERKIIEADLGSKLYSAACQGYEARLNGKSLGLALLDDEIGKHLPITFLVALDARSKVRRVELLTYRERYGQGIQSRKFMAQFDGKSAGDPLFVTRGIDAVTGATISSRSISLGVRKALRIADKFKEIK